MQPGPGVARLHAAHVVHHARFVHHIRFHHTAVAAAAAGNRFPLRRAEHRRGPHVVHVHVGGPADEELLQVHVQVQLGHLCTPVAEGAQRALSGMEREGERRESEEGPNAKPNRCYFDYVRQRTCHTATCLGSTQSVELPDTRGTRLGVWTHPPRPLGFVHRSRTIFCRPVPNLTLRFATCSSL